MGTHVGTGPTETAPFTIAAGTIQWRVRWRCESGTLHIESVPPPRRRGALVDGTCPGQGDGYSILTGEIRLRVQSSGPWEATVEQQVTTPLAEPPLLGTEPAQILASGDFYRVERTGTGTARVYELPDGQKALRLDPFEVSQNTDLFVWLSEADTPRTSAEVVAAPHVEIAELKSTLGTQNYVLPDIADMARMKSVVIWCAPVRIAYSAAALARP